MVEITVIVAMLALNAVLPGTRWSWFAWSDGIAEFVGLAMFVAPLSFVTIALAELFLANQNVRLL